MKITLSLLAALIFYFTLAIQAHAMSGREIMDKTNALKKPDTAKSVMTMIITKDGEATEKEFELMSKKTGDSDRLLFSFIKPSQLKLLSHKNKGRDNDQWLMLSSGKTKRIAGSEKGKPFAGSHFYYEDLNPLELNDADFEYIGEGKAGGFDCYKVEGVKKKDKVYDKSVMYVRKSDYFIIRIDLYMKGQLHKYVENYDIKAVNGIITPYKTVMFSAEDTSKTEMIVKSVKYNLPLSNSIFLKESLR
jgi:hypothetical protein